METKEISARLKKFREFLRLKQREMADALGVTLSAYSNYEAGGRKIPQEIRIPLRKLGLDLNWLDTGEGEMAAPPGQAGPATSTGSLVAEGSEPRRYVAGIIGPDPKRMEAWKAMDPDEVEALVTEAARLIDRALAGRPVTDLRKRDKLLALVAAELAEERARGQAGELARDMEAWVRELAAVLVR